MTKIAAVNTIKKIALTEEEAAMNGAPEGELFNVELLERGDVEGIRWRGGAGVQEPIARMGRTSTPTGARAGGVVFGHHTTSTTA